MITYLFSSTLHTHIHPTPVDSGLSECLQAESRNSRCTNLVERRIWPQQQVCCTWNLRGEQYRSPAATEGLEWLGFESVHPRGLWGRLSHSTEQNKQQSGFGFTRGWVGELDAPTTRIGEHRVGAL